MSDDEPTPRRIAVEGSLYALAFLAVGAAIVGLRVLREGPRILSGDPRALRTNQGTERDPGRTAGPQIEVAPGGIEGGPGDRR